jgi:hypothetical protein
MIIRFVDTEENVTYLRVADAYLDRYKNGHYLEEGIDSLSAIENGIRKQELRLLTDEETDELLKDQAPEEPEAPLKCITSNNSTGSIRHSASKLVGPTEVKKLLRLLVGCEVSITVRWPTPKTFEGVPTKLRKRTFDFRRIAPDEPHDNCLTDFEYGGIQSILVSKIAAEKSTFDVILKEVRRNKAGVIKEIRTLVPGLGLAEAKVLVENAPKTVCEGVTKKEADKIKNCLEAIGAKVEVK